MMLINRHVLGLILGINSAQAMEAQQEYSQREHYSTETTNQSGSYPSFYHPPPSAPHLDNFMYPAEESPLPLPVYSSPHLHSATPNQMTLITNTYQDQLNKVDLFLAGFPDAPTNIPTNIPSNEPKQQLDQSHIMVPADVLKELLESNKILNDKIDALMEAQIEQQAQNEHIASGQDLIKEQLSSLQEHYHRLKEDILNPNQTPFQKAMNITGLTIKVGTSVMTSVTSYNMATSLVMAMPAFMAPPAWVPLSVALISGGYLFMKTT